MKTFIDQIKRYSKKPWVIGVAVLVLIILFVAIRGRGKTPDLEVVRAERQTVQEEVSVTGNVKSATAIDMSFPKSAKVASAPKNVGDQVKAGEILAALDVSDLAAQRAQAIANLRYQQAKLSSVQLGTRPEQISVSQAKYVNAQSSLNTAQSALVTALQNSYTAADDAIRGKTDEVFVNPTTYPQVIFQADPNVALSIQSGRIEVESRLKNLLLISTKVATSTDTDIYKQTIKQDLAEVKLFLDNLALIINGLPQNYFSDPKINVTQWRSDLSAARTEVNNAITSILTAEDKVRTQQAALISAQGELTIEQAGNISQDIDAQQAQVAASQASVAAIDAQINQLILRSPIDGVVTKQDAKVGQTVNPNVVVVSVINNAQYEIEAKIAEADIAKVKVGQQADVTLDAYGSDVHFPVTVVEVDPAETIVDGVPTYKTTFQFTTADPRIKSGMTANIDIRGDKRENVIAIPQRAIVSRGGQKYVTIKQGNTMTEVPVQTGLRGSDGLVEIMSGVSDGALVVVGQTK